MPPEPLPWDRRDCFKERKHERSSETVGSVSRWRENQIPHLGSRWGSSEFRGRLPGHGKQGNWHLYSEEPGYGFSPSGSNERILDDDSFRPSGSRADGKYGRNGRESRGSFNQKDWRGNYWQNGASLNGHGRQLDLSDQRLVDGMLTYKSPPRSDSVNPFNPSQHKDQHDNAATLNGLGTGQRFERENSLGSIDWKPIKWTRSGSLSSRGSGFSHSSGLKTIGVDSSEAKAEVQLRNVTLVQSPSGDTVACPSSAAPSDETSSRKKPRLNWGEGLAKYEKKKVGSPEDSAIKQGLTVIVDTEPSYSHISNLSDKSPGIAGVSDCVSPATPSSVACNPSPGVEHKPFVNTANADDGFSILSGSPSVLHQSPAEGNSSSLESLEFIPVANLSSLLGELLQSDDSGPIAMNKLLVWKGEILKALEVTESEIDSLENELKSFSASSLFYTAESIPLQLEWQQKPCEEPAFTSNAIPEPAHLQVNSSVDMILEKAAGDLEEHSLVKNENLDSTITVAPTIVDSSGKAITLPEPVENNSADVLDASVSKTQVLKGSICGLAGENTEVLSKLYDWPTVEQSPAAAPVGELHSDREEMLPNLILASNKERADRASELFNKLLPPNQCQNDVLMTTHVSSWQSNPLIKEKFDRRRRFLRFKERIVALKYRAFQHLWKEDMQLLSTRKHRTKSQKKLEMNSRMWQGSQKHRSSIRSRFSSPAGKLALVPTTGTVNFTSKLTSDLQVKLYRNSLKMPSMILDEKEKMISRFISSNGLVEDPCAVEKERTTINPWTVEEKEVFMDKFVTFGKDFSKIASYLEHKTTADCIKFYYKNHKSDCFVKLKKKPELAWQGKPCSSNNYMVTSGKRWNRETNVASIEVLGEASTIASNADGGMENQKKLTASFSKGVTTDCRTIRGDDAILERSGSDDIFNNERETMAADVLVGICGSMSSEAMSSCITNSFDLGDSYQDWKCQKLGSSSTWPLTPEVTQKVDDETCSDESCGEMNPTDWTDEEKSTFIRAVSSYGKDFTMISGFVKTKSMDQCRVFYSKARKCLGLDANLRPGDDERLESDDVNGGGSDNEDACILEMGSAICSEKSGCKIDEDVMLSELNTNHCDSDPGETVSLLTGLNRTDENNGTGEIDYKNPELHAKNIGPGMDDKMDLDIDGDGQMENNVNSMSLAAESLTNVALPPDVEAGGDEAVGESVCSGQGGHLLVSENISHHKQGKKVDADAGGIADLNCLDQVLHANDSGLTAELSICVGCNSKQGQKNAMELNPALEQHATSLQQDISLVNTSKQDTPSIINFEKISNKQAKKSSSTSECDQYLSGHSLSGDAGTCQILRGYPLKMSTDKEINGDISSKTLVSHQSFSKEDRNLHANTCLSPKWFLQKCKNSKDERSVPELLFLTREAKNDHSRPPSQGSSEAEKPRRNGDVKLFGQILSHPSAQPRHSNTSISHEDKGTQHSNSSSKSFSLNFANALSVDGVSVPVKLGGKNSNSLGFENVPVRSYGFWDGNRIQTGFSSLSDSAMLLAKYPNAFSNYTVGAKIEQQPSHSVMRTGEHKLNSVSVFPTREVSSSNRGADYPFFWNRESARGKPFTIDFKQQQDMLFAEMQRRNGFDRVLSLQQQARGLVGANVVSRGSILVGGVTDPVAAIKMHYAKAEQCGGGQNANIIREEESWRGKGDIGR